MDWQNFIAKKYLKYLYIIIGVALLVAGIFYYLNNQTEKNTLAETKATVVSYEDYLNKPYQFSDFAVDFKEYKIADIKFEGDFKLEDNPNYWNDWKNIFANLNASNLNFAGHFKLVSAGNGTMRELYLVDGLTGIIYPYKEMTIPGASRYLFKENSRLLVEIIDNEFGFINTTKEAKVYAYYLLQVDKSFELLGLYVYNNNSFIKVSD